MVLSTETLTRDDEGNIRPDFLFSYWITMWFIVFVFLEPRWRAVFPNPLIIFIIGVIENILTFLLIINTVTIINVLKFIIMVLFSKIIPIFILWRYRKINYKLDITAGIILFLVYMYWLYIHNENVYDIYRNTLVSLQNNDSRTPFFNLIHSMFGI